MSEEEKISPQPEAAPLSKSSLKKGEDSDAEGPPQPEFLAKMPKDIRQLFMSLSSMQMTGFPHQSSQIVEKLTPEHITQIINNAQEDSKIQDNQEFRNKIFGFLYYLGGGGIFVFLVLTLLPTNKELLQEILKLAIVFGGGIGLGIGLRRRESNN